MRQIFKLIWAILLLLGHSSIYASSDQAKELKWMNGDSLPVGGYQFLMLSNENDIYTLGGTAKSEGNGLILPSGKIFYCRNTRLCEPRASMITPRHSFSASIVDGKIYVLGGLNINNSPTEVIEVYHPDGDFWQLKNSNLPTPRYALASVAYRGKVYAVGGAFLDNAGNVKSTSLLEVYEPNKDEWLQKKAQMPTPRHGLSLIELQGKIYAIGGMASGREASGVEQTALSTVEVYDPIKDVWQKKQNMPTPRAWLTTFVANQRIYAIGGKTSNDNQLNDVESYDPVSNSWRVEKAMPDELSSHMSVVLDNEIVISGNLICKSYCVSETYKLMMPQSNSILFSSQNIDSFFKKKWLENNILPARLSDDFEFQRRVTLDILGRVPTLFEIKKFSKNKNRKALIELLLSDEIFYKYWSEILSNQIYGSGFGILGHEKNATAKFIAQQLKLNSGYKKIVAEIISAEPAPHLGANQINAGALVGYYAAQLKNPKRIEDLVNNIGRAFMGSQLHCAQCHDSHVDKRTTQADYYGLVAFFSGLRVVNGNLVDTSKVEYKPEKYSKPLSPRYINGEAPKHNETNRAAFARLLTNSEEFSLSFTNNIWSIFFGIPLVNPTNSIGINPESEIHPLLRNLSIQVKKDNFDLKKLIRLIANSEVYQITSKHKKPLPNENLYSVHAVRPMNPEQMFSSIAISTGLEKAYLREKLPEEATYMTHYSHDFDFIKQLYIETINKTADYDNPSSHYEYTANISQVLKSLDMNSLFYAGTKFKNDGRLKEIVKRNDSMIGVVTELYLYTVSRPPRKRELDESINFIKAQVDIIDGYEKLFLALLNTNEFFFIH